MIAWDVVTVSGLALMALGISGAILTRTPCPDANRDADVLLGFAEGAVFTATREGKIGYYVRLGERSYRALTEDRASITIGPSVMKVTP